MIRHFFLNKVTLICALVLMVSCSSDDITIMENEELSTKQQQIILDTTLNLSSITVIYKKGITEPEKTKIRSQYFDKYKWFFKEWTECNGYTDIWSIVGSTRPRIEVDESDEDVERVYGFSTCFTIDDDISK